MSPLLLIYEVGIPYPTGFNGLNSFISPYVIITYLIPASFYY